MKQEEVGSGTMGASVDGAPVHAVVKSCALFGSLFVVLCALSVVILVAVNWRPWRIYRYLSQLQLVCILVLGSLDSSFTL